MVGRDTPDTSAKVFCSMPISDRAAFIWAAVSNAPLHFSEASPRYIQGSALPDGSRIIADLRLMSQASGLQSFAGSIDVVAVSTGLVSCQSSPRSDLRG